MKLDLDIDQQNALLIAFQQLDSYQVVSPGVEDGAKLVSVPYKLGIARRAVVKNINVLRTSLLSFEEINRSLFKETWPDAPDGANIKKEDDPENFARFQTAVAKIVKTKEQLDLLPLPASVLYPADPAAREFPNQALVTLEEHGLVEEAAAAA
jgi:hypothetical protein